MAPNLFGGALNKGIEEFIWFPPFTLETYFILASTNTILDQELRKLGLLGLALVFSRICSLVGLHSTVHIPDASLA